MPPYAMAGAVGKFQASTETVYYRAHSQESEIVLFHALDETVELSVPGEGVLWVGSWEIDGERFLVASVADSDDTSSLHRWNDTDDDGMPDAGSRQLVFDTGSNQMYLSDLTAPRSGRSFALDLRCADILVVEDSGSDGWPDLIFATPFAKSDDHPELEVVGNISAVGTSGAIAYQGTSEGKHAPTTWYLLDTDDDDVVDSFAAKTAGPIRPPFPKGLLFDGQLSVELEAGTASGGLVAEVWELDSNDDDVVQLGAVTLDADGEGSISLTTALAEGTRIGIRTSGAQDQYKADVIDDRPQVLAVDPPAVPPSAASSITLEGVNLSSSTVVHLRLGEATPITLSVTSVTSTQLTADVPDLQAETGELAWLWLTDSGAPADASKAICLRMSLASCFSVTSLSPSTASVGNEITVSGTGFDLAPVREIEFGGGVKATILDVTVVDGTTLKVNVPQGAQTGTITVRQGSHESVSPSALTVQ